MTATDLHATPRVGTTPIPLGRGRWQLMAYQRQFTTAQPTIIANLVNARGRRLTQAWNTPAELTFTLDGHDPEARLITELATDIVATRWDEYANTGQGYDIFMFRGLIDHSEDQITEQSATVTFTAHDYLGILARRIICYPTPVSFNNDQDSVVQYLLYYASTWDQASNGTSFNPGSFLPLVTMPVNPDGSYRNNPSGQVRARSYPGSTVIATALDDLAKVQNGFDYDILPSGPAAQADTVRIFYPQQGVARTDVALVFGANVATVTRTVASGDYANFVRVLGNNATSDQTAAQVYAEAWNTDANNVTVNPVGLWQTGVNAADVSVTQTLTDQANGLLAYDGLLTPTYTLGLTPGRYRRAYPNMGDAVPLVINEGRLNVNTSVRVLGITYDINDDGNEDVTLTVGRPPTTLAKMLSAGQRDIDALNRR